MTFMGNFITGALIVVLPYVLIGLFPFWGNWRMSKVKTMLAVALFTVCFTLYNTIFIHLFFEYKWALHFYNATFCVVVPLFSYWIVKTSAHKLLYAQFIHASYICYVCNVSTYLQTVFFPTGFGAISGYIYRFIHAVVLLVSVPFILLFLRRLVKPIISSSYAAAWKYMWFIPTIFVVVSMVYTGVYDINRIAEPQYLIITLLLAAGSFLVYYIVIKMVRHSDQNLKLTQQLALQGEHYRSLQEHIAETRRAKHDLRHHMLVLKAHIDTDGKDELKAYLDQYSDSIGDDGETAFCKNFAVNSIVSYYLGMAKSEGVPVDVCLELPQDIDISDMDLCIIFGNCFENSIEACRKVEGDKFIKLNSKMKGKMLAITIDNSFDGEVKKEGSNFLSLKEGGQGIGISSVKAVAEKYGGSAQFEAERNAFKATVILRAWQG